MNDLLKRSVEPKGGRRGHVHRVEARVRDEMVLDGFEITDAYRGYSVNDRMEIKVTFGASNFYSSSLNRHKSLPQIIQENRRLENTGQL